jgi:hypothetical protein
MASRMAARSTTAGTPVKSWSSTRAGMKAISRRGLGRIAVAPRPASASIRDLRRRARPGPAGAANDPSRPSSRRSRFSSRIFIRLFLGYAGWGEGQLLEEILRNDWLVAPVAADLVFAASPEQAWAEALRSLGVDPETLPSWTPTGGGDDAN